MASKKGDAETWIKDETYVHETSSYGENQRGVSDALSEQEKRVQLVKGYGQDAQNKGDASVKRQYEDLSVLAEKRLSCLKNIAHIANLEEVFGNATAVVSAKAASLGRKEAEAKEEDKPASASLARAAQGCMFAVQDNWSWISKLVRCTDVHLKNAAEYHQFYHELRENDLLMRSALSRELQQLQAKELQQDQQKLLLKIKELLTLFLHWQHKVNGLFERSKKVLPVHLRTTRLDYFRPVTSLCSYKTRQITIHEGEELTLVDNSKPLLWRIHNLHNTEANIPSVILVVPGPDHDAIAMGNRLRLQLLGLWTQYLKELGISVLKYLLLIFKEKWTEEETKKLKAMPGEQKDALRRLMSSIEDYFSQYWSQHPDFQQLQRRFSTLREIIGQQGREEDRDLKFGSSLLNQLTTFEQIFGRYKDYWTQWETFKIMLETSRHPEYMLLSENWEQLGFYEMSEVLKKWYLGASDRSLFSSQAETVTKETAETSQTEVITKETVDTVDSALSRAEETTTEWSTQEETAATDELMHSQQEEARKFVISGVKDPRTGEAVSMQEAVDLGILNNKNGTYVDIVTKKSMPIPEAMNKGLILVEFVSSRKSEEKRQDIGLITIKTMKESRPYTVKKVIDAKTDKELTVDEAMAKGILNQTKGLYHNSLTRSDMSLADAIDSGLLLVEFDKSAKVGKPEAITKTYAINGVVDVKRKVKLSFSEAVRKRIFDKETGAFTNNLTGESMYVGDAIKKGFVKASVVSDPDSLDIDPENKMVVEKLDILRKKLLKPMIAVAALRKASVKV